MELKKIFFGLVLTTVLMVGLTVPLESSATTVNCCEIHRTFSFGGETWVADTCYGEVTARCARPDGTELCPTTIVRANWGVGCILNTVYRITDLIFALLIVITIIIALAGAFNILTAGGAAEKVNKGRDLIIYGIIGVIVAFFARAIPSIIGMLL